VARRISLAPPTRMHRIFITGLCFYVPVVATTVATAASHELCQWQALSCPYFYSFRTAMSDAIKQLPAGRKLKLDFLNSMLRSVLIHKQKQLGRPKLDFLNSMLRSVLIHKQKQLGWISTVIKKLRPASEISEQSRDIDCSSLSKSKSRKANSDRRNIGTQ